MPAYQDSVSKSPACGGGRGAGQATMAAATRTRARRCAPRGAPSRPHRRGQPRERRRRRRGREQARRAARRRRRRPRQRLGDVRAPQAHRARVRRRRRRGVARRVGRRQRRLQPVRRQQPAAQQLQQLRVRELVELRAGGQGGQRGPRGRESGGARGGDVFTSPLGRPTRAHSRRARNAAQCSSPANQAAGDALAWRRARPRRRGGPRRRGTARVGARAAAATKPRAPPQPRSTTRRARRRRVPHAPIAHTRSSPSGRTAQAWQRFKRLRTPRRYLSKREKSKRRCQCGAAVARLAPCRTQQIKHFCTFLGVECGTAHLCWKNGL
jgi:hypothetical protein